MVKLENVLPLVKLRLVVPVMLASRGIIVASQLHPAKACVLVHGLTIVTQTSQVLLSMAVTVAEVATISNPMENIHILGFVLSNTKTTVAWTMEASSRLINCVVDKLFGVET